MARFFKKREEIKGLSPGSLVFVGNKKVDNIRIRVIDYDGAQLKDVNFIQSACSWLQIIRLQRILQLIAEVEACQAPLFTFRQ